MVAKNQEHVEAMAKLIAAGFRVTPAAAERGEDHKLLFGSVIPRVWITQPTPNAAWVITVPDVKIEIESDSPFCAVDSAIRELRETAAMATKAADALVEARAILRLSR